MNTMTPVPALETLPGRELDRDELERIAATLAGDPASWHPHASHDAAERHFALAHRDEHVEVYVISWQPGHDTGFHDHGVSAGAFAIASGQLTEERLRLDGPSFSRVLAAGESAAFSPAAIHRVRHAGGEPAVSVHVYSPPLAALGTYAAGVDGELERHQVEADAELRPRAATA